MLVLSNSDLSLSHVNLRVNWRELLEKVVSSRVNWRELLGVRQELGEGGERRIFF